jgi:SAM-dependent methyltransferase
MDVDSAGIDSAAPGTEFAPCVCGATETTARTVVARDPESGEIFRYVACAACGLERLAPRPVAERIGRYYPRHYYAHGGPAQGRPSLATRIKALIYDAFWAPAPPRGRPPLALRIALYPLRFRSVMAFRHPAVRRVFEFGVGNANDLLTFRAAGWEIAGCEPSLRACERAAEAGIAVQNCRAEDARLPAAHYSCIVMNNALEHLHDPGTVLDTCFASLVPDGVLVLIVPNHASWTARLFGAAWPGYDAPRHLWGWSPASITRALAAIGFAIDYIHHQAPTPWLWESTIEGRNAPTPPSRTRMWLGRNLAYFCLPFGLLAAWAGRGDFIRVVARKPAAGRHRAGL